MGQVDADTLCLLPRPCSNFLFKNIGTISISSMLITICAIFSTLQAGMTNLQVQCGVAFTNNIQNPVQGL